MSSAELVTYVFLGILFAWSVSWFSYSAYRIWKDGRGHPKHSYWVTHSLWSVINIAIAALSLRSSLNAESFDDEYTRNQRGLVGFNMLLDVVYLAVAFRLMKSKKHNLRESGKAIAIQGGFLLIFDLFLVAAYTLSL